MEVFVSVQIEPPQSVRVAGQEQRLLEHSASTGQTWPHAPQLWLSEVRSVQRSSHPVFPGGHEQASTEPRQAESVPMHRV